MGIIFQKAFFQVFLWEFLRFSAAFFALRGKKWAQKSIKKDPLTRAGLFIANLLHDQQDEGQHQEQGAHPLGAASHLGIQGLGLVLSQEGVSSAAADGAGQASVLAGLEHGHHNNSQAAQQLQDRNQHRHKENLQ